MTIKVDLGDFEMFKTALDKSFVTVGMTLLLFAIYVGIFGQSIYFLATSPNTINRRLQFIWIMSLFVMATIVSCVAAANDVMDAVMAFDALKAEDPSTFLRYGVYSPAKSGVIAVTYFGYLVANSIADSILIHRLYIIWGSRKRTIVLPFLASGAANGLGLAAAIMLTIGSDMRNPSNLDIRQRAIRLQNTYWAMNAVVNIFLTCGIAGRIWWVARDTQQISGGLQRNCINPQFRTVITMVIESGLLYITVLIIQACFAFNASRLNVPVNLVPTVILVAGMAPTLIILRVNCNRALNKSRPPERISTMHFGSLFSHKEELQAVETSSLSSQTRGAVAPRELECPQSLN